MAQMFDSVRQADIPASAELIAAYMDGRVSAWSEEDFKARENAHVIRGSVLANAEADWFDSENGNANVDEVAEACAVRIGNGKPAVCYSNRANLAGLENALAAKELRFTSATEWPKLGVYLFAADWNNEAHTEVEWAPVQPVAVQYATSGGYDTSETFGAFPSLSAPGPVESAPAAPPAPAAPAQLHYEVRQGDTLWSIAAHFLGKGTLWAEIYAANHAAIGDNPNLIHPGLDLVIP